MGTTDAGVNVESRPGFAAPPAATGLAQTDGGGHGPAAAKPHRDPAAF